MAKFDGNQVGPGRPKGSKNKSYLNLNLWFELLHDDLLTMQPKERVDLVMQAIDRLISKVQSLPATPGDSVNNALETFNLINGLGGVNTPLESKDKPLRSDANDAH